MHSMMTERIPNSAWRKADIVAWLNLKNIRFEESCVKTELLGIVKQNRHKFKKFVVNEIAEKSGHTVLRLPPYHCTLNPTELIWSQLKGYVARHNTTSVSYTHLDVYKRQRLYVPEPVRKLLNHNFYKILPRRRRCRRQLLENLFNAEKFFKLRGRVGLEAR